MLETVATKCRDLASASAHQSTKDENLQITMYSYFVIRRGLLSMALPVTLEKNNSFPQAKIPLAKEDYFKLQLRSYRI
jgi:hypothetical protein